MSSRRPRATVSTFHYLVARRGIVRGNAFLGGFLLVFVFAVLPGFFRNEECKCLKPVFREEREVPLLPAPLTGDDLPVNRRGPLLPRRCIQDSE